MSWPSPKRVRTLTCERLKVFEINQNKMIVKSCSVPPPKKSLPEGKSRGTLGSSFDSLRPTLPDADVCGRDPPPHRPGSKENIKAGKTYATLLVMLPSNPP